MKSISSLGCRGIDREWSLKTGQDSRTEMGFGSNAESALLGGSSLFSFRLILLCARDARETLI
jgi:hypothetical protein